MGKRPVAAFASSFGGGLITTASALIGINSWMSLRRELDPGFS